MTDDVGYGLGGLYAEDPRDWPISQLYEAQGIAALAEFPSSFLCANLGPVLNQGPSPKCVAFAGSSVKAHQDWYDQGHVYFDFDEDLFYTQIGGTSQGAYISAALKRLTDYGYPVKTIGQAAQHKIAAYYAVPKTTADMKSALMSFGPLWAIGQWWNEWSYSNIPSTGVLRAPVSKWSGHSIEIVGWNTTGWILKQSWGTGCGAGGYLTLPYAYTFDNSGSGGAKGYLWAAYKTVDVIETPASPVYHASVIKATRLWNDATKQWRYLLPVGTALLVRGALYLKGGQSCRPVNGPAPYTGYYVPAANVKLGARV